MIRTISNFVFATALICLTGVVDNKIARAGTIDGDADAGLALAQKVCAVCHVVAKGVRVKSEENAPAFQSIADDAQFTEMSLRVYLQTPRDKMPNLMLNRKETDDLITYIISLK
jgi:mono/diheme cytochrome c family protein